MVSVTQLTSCLPSHLALFSDQRTEKQENMPLLHNQNKATTNMIFTPIPMHSRNHSTHTRLSLLLHSFDTFLLYRWTLALNNIESRAEMNERGRAGLQEADVYEEEVICPKPHRGWLSLVEYTKPMRQWWQSSSRMKECEAGFEILEIFLNKSASGEGDATV